MTLRCTYCGTAVDDGAERCPKCLRKSSLASSAEADAVERERALEKLWPSGSTCPLCGERDVGDGVFFIQLSKAAQSLAGVERRWLSARGRCCVPCQTRLQRLEIWRWGALAAILVGFVATYGVASLLEEVGLERFAIPSMLAGLVASLVVPLIVWRVVHNRVRGAVASLWMVDMLRATIDEPDGVPIYDLVNIHAKLKNDEEVVDLDAIRREKQT